MIKRKFEIKNKRELIIRGFLCFPEGLKEKIPVVIMSHGYTATMYNDADLVEPLVKKNIGAVIFDFCGGSLESSSDGAFTDMSVITEVDDLETVISYVRSTNLFSDIFLLGVSQGGLVTAIVGAKEKENIKGIIYYYPGFVIPDYARSLYGKKENIPEYPTSLGLTVGKRYFADVIDLDAYKYPKEYDGPVLILHGTADPLVSPTDSIRVKELYKNAELILYEGQGHGFTGEYRKYCINAVINFIEKHI